MWILLLILTTSEGIHTTQIPFNSKEQCIREAIANTYRTTVTDTRWYLTSNARCIFKGY